jgi:PTH1 family peptidyl-tRNA hydrolase
VIDALVVGLGNPGKQYERTRHNVGEEALRLLAERTATTLKAGRDHALVGDARVDERRVLLAFPITFMNESGRAVRAICKRHGVHDPSQIIVIHDELDLPPGTVRVKEGGGLAGNNGLRSIASHLGTQDFLRIRIGIGKPPSKELGARHVLSSIPPAERLLLDEAVVVAADAAERIVADGAQAAMALFNGR